MCTKVLKNIMPFMVGWDTFSIWPLLTSELQNQECYAKRQAEEMRVTMATDLNMLKTKVCELQIINSPKMFSLFCFACLLGKQRNRAGNVLVQIHSLRESELFQLPGTS